MIILSFFFYKIFSFLHPTSLSLPQPPMPESSIKGLPSKLSFWFSHRPPFHSSIFIPCLSISSKSHSKIDQGEAESMEISLMEKKVTITLSRIHVKQAKMSENEIQPAVAIFKNQANKYSLMKRIFCSSSS